MNKNHASAQTGGKLNDEEHDDGKTIRRKRERRRGRRKGVLIV